VVAVGGLQRRSGALQSAFGGPRLTPPTSSSGPAHLHRAPRRPRTQARRAPGLLPRRARTSLYLARHDRAFSPTLGSVPRPSGKQSQSNSCPGYASSASPSGIQGGSGIQGSPQLPCSLAPPLHRSPAPPSRSSGPYSWSALMRRVVQIGVLHCTHCTHCTHCGGRRKLIAFITNPPDIRRLLLHLKLPADPPAVAPAASHAPP
jgi:hypothetical protein